MMMMMTWYYSILVAFPLYYVSHLQVTHSCFLFPLVIILAFHPLQVTSLHWPFSLPRLRVILLDISSSSLGFHTPLLSIPPFTPPHLDFLFFFSYSSGLSVYLSSYFSSCPPFTLAFLFFHFKFLQLFSLQVSLAFFLLLRSSFRLFSSHLQIPPGFPTPA